MSSEKFHQGICKQVNQGDSIVIRDLVSSPTSSSKTVGISNINCPRLLFRNQVGGQMKSVDDRCAWEAREFLRQKIIGRNVVYTESRMPKGGIYGDVYIGQTPSLENNVAFMMVSEGFAEVRKIGNPEVAAKTKNYQQLVEAEEGAKAAEKGMWDPNGPPTGRTVCWLPDDPAKLLERLRNKPVRGIVEYVRDGCSMQVCLLPPADSIDKTYYHVMVLLAGIRTPGFKMDNGKLVGEPLAEEARAYVEARILQRELTVHLYQQSGQSFLGSLIHPNGDICEFLLGDGLARCIEWSMEHVKNAEAYRAKETKAKNGRRGLWVNYKPPPPPSEAEIAMNKLKRANAGATFSGTIAEVGLGDNVVVKFGEGSRRKFFLSSIRPLRYSMAPATADQKPPSLPKGAKPLFDIPYMFEAREFLRKHIGKRVEVHVDYTLPKPEGTTLEDRVCASIQVVGGPNLAEALLSRGLAQVVRYRKNSADPRAKNYDALVAAEEDAKQKQVGWHNPGPAPRHNVHEVTGTVSKALLPSLQRSGKLSGVVEFVTSGSRLKVFVPKDNKIITLLLGGIICFRNTSTRPDGKTEKGEPFGDEAAELTRDLCMHRNVEFEVEGMDRRGNFIGTVYTHSAYSVAGHVRAGDSKALQAKGKTITKMLNAILLLNGFAYVHRSFAATKAPHFGLLSKCEAEATGAEVGCWGSKEFVDQWNATLKNGQPDENANYDHDLPDREEKQKQRNEPLDPAAQQVNDVSELKKRIASAKAAHLLMVSVNDPDSVGVRVFMQASADSQKLQEITAELASKPPSPSDCQGFQPQRGQLCAAKFSFDGLWYRAQVLSIQNNSQFTVQYVDFGNEEVHDLAKAKTIGPLPSKLTGVPLITRPYRLLGICLPPEMPDRLTVADYLSDSIGQDEVLMSVESQSPVPCGKEDKKPVPTVCLFWKKSGAGSSSEGEKAANDVAEKLLQEGLVYCENARLPKDVLHRYEAAQEQAKKARRAIWRYGDCRPDD